MTFRVGQKVCCVDAVSDTGRHWLSDAPQVGKIYTIAAIVDGVYGDYTALHLAEIKNDPGLGYRATRFRPIVSRKTDISIFTALLVPGAKIRELT